MSIPENVEQGFKRVSAEIAGRTLTLETGRLAQLSMGAVTVQYGDSLVLTSAIGEKEAKEDMGFFPLTVDYEERMFAAGKIPGGFPKREGRPTEAAILACRLTDRPIRPLFPKGYKAEVQIMTTVLSADQENDCDILSIIGASAGLTIGPIPFEGPVGAVRMGLVDGEFVVNPTFAQREEGDLDMVIAGTDDAIMMVEGEAREISEEKMVQAIEVAHDVIRQIVQLQRELQGLVGVEKWAFVSPKRDEELFAAVSGAIAGRLREVVRNPDKVVRLEATGELQKEVVAQLTEGEDARFTAQQVNSAYEALLKDEVRSGILDEGVRPDGRGVTEIRPIWTQVGYLPRAHGSAVFTRGQTQALTVVALGSTAEEQRLDSITPATSKRYIHHYNFPPYSVGEVRRLRGASRRDIGHGALAERALVNQIPATDVFPYTIRVVSEIMASNGSSSMASVCGSTMALMDAGVPLKKPVAGVAMGLITDGDTGRYTVLTDIQGMEDALGDMDFKVAGTPDGVTAIQMDIKVKGISYEIMRQALAQAHEGREHILGKMMETISAPREQLSKFAPQVVSIKINPEKIGKVIGPGGSMIREIQEESNSKINIEDDGTISIASADGEGIERAKAKILALTEDLPQVNVERGEIYNGKVVSIMPYGAFVEIAPGRDGLVHISELSEDPAIRTERVEDVVKEGEEITVMVIDVAPNGKVSLSRRAALTGELPEPKAPRPPRRDGDRGPRRDDRGPRRDDRGPRGPRYNG
ncbi:MAG: polyribonucleotide nucleotidyltransferase [Thermomicrobiales bacterium]|nr:polyribonucleotide nucleotidyltransferase [Thermomicrobiales bacterium]